MCRFFQVAKPSFEAMTIVGEPKLAATDFEFFVFESDIKLSIKKSDELNTGGLEVAFLSKMFSRV